MTTSTLTITAGGGRRTDPAGIAAVLARYQESQSGYAIIAEPARHAVLEIGDRMQGLRDALGPAEPGRGWDPGTDGTQVSLVCAVLRDAVDPRPSQRKPAST
jgi:hypothetical protein